MGSTRLPGKVMLPAGSAPLLGWLLNRVSHCSLIDTIVVATPEGSENAGIWDFVKNSPVRLVRGPEDDVLGRVLKAARETKTDVIVELTADCPVIDPAIIDMCVGYYLCGRGGPAQDEQYDFVGNVAPRTWPRGMDTRVFSTDTLERVDKEVRGDTREAYWREHVSPWMYERAESPYVRRNVEAPPEHAYQELNLSVDTPDDYRRLKMLIEDLGTGNPLFTVDDSLTHLAGLPGYEFLTAPHIETDAAWLSDLKQTA